MSNPGTSFTSLREVKAAGGRWPLDEFVEVVNSLIERYLPANRAGNVKLNVKLSDVFNPRLVRYYGTMGLIAPPEKEGKEARYHYGHLLQALVIRRLLFEGFTAPALLKMLAGKTEGDYEAMLAGGVSVAAAAAPSEVEGHLLAPNPSPHLRLVRDLMAAGPPPAKASPPRFAPSASAPPSVSPSPPFRAVPAPAPAPVVIAAPPVPETPPASAALEAVVWRRFAVAPGLELHLRADFRLPTVRAEREALLFAVLEQLQRGGEK